MKQEFFITAAILLILSILFFLLFKWKKEVDFKKNTIWQIVLSFLVMGLIGALAGIAVSEFNPGNNYYFWFQILLLLCGVLHTWILYRKLYWRKRDIFDKEEDSFLPEFLYTLFITSFSALAFFIAFSIIEWEIGLAKVFVSAFMVFPLPFIILKSFDAVQQIEKPKFEHEWIYSSAFINVDDISWNQNSKVHFAVTQNFIDQRIFYKRRNSDPWSFFPADETSLGKIFDVFVQVNNKQYPNSAIEELNVNAKGEPIWWLFSRKFRLTDAKTWGKKKYLNPTTTLSGNEINPGDIVYVTRRLKE